MTMPDKGVAFHVHHTLLVEVCWSKAERLADIEQTKPAHEVPTRKRLLQIIPLALLPAEVQQTYAAWEKANAAWEKANAAIVAHMPEIEVLHKQLCPDCPWNGETIFPKVVTP